MTITSGIDGRAFLDEFDISGTAAQANEISSTIAQLNKVAFNTEAMRRANGLRDGRLAVTCHFDDAAGQSFDALTDFPASTAQRQLTYLHRATLGAAAISIQGRQTNVDWNRSSDGDLMLSASVAGSGYGLEMGRALTAGLATSTGTEALTGFDDGAGAATDLGLQAYLHVVAFSGTSVDIVIQDSDDDAATDPYTDITGAAFTTVTGVGFERIQTSRTENVKEWLRVDLDGTYTNLQFTVVVIPNRKTAAAF